MAASVRNTAIKRIQGDVREMMTNPSDQYAAAPLESNMFDWHFTLRGPRDTEFEGGIYHGRILLPADYPFKPPNIMLLTPNGRFEVKKKICLSISAHHPEEWQPAWGVRLILEALISFMPTKGEGAIGALDFPAEERRRLAKQSVEFKCETCGRIADLLPELEEADGEQKETKPSKYAAQIAQLHVHSLEKPTASSSEQAAAAAPSTGEAQDTHSKQDETMKSTESIPAPTEEQQTPASVVSEAPVVETQTPQIETLAPTPVTEDEFEVTDAGTPQVTSAAEPIMDTMLHYLTIALAVALFAMIYKKLLQMQGVLQN